MLAAVIALVSSPKSFSCYKMYGEYSIVCLSHSPFEPIWEHLIKQFVTAAAIPHQVAERSHFCSSGEQNVYKFSSQKASGILCFYNYKLKKIEYALWKELEILIAWATVLAKTDSSLLSCWLMGIVKATSSFNDNW